MESTWPLKVALLVVALVGVVWLTRQINPQSTAEILSNMGMDMRASSSPRSKATVIKETTVNLCPTRIKAVQWPDGSRIEERLDSVRPRWVSLKTSEPGKVKDLNYLDLEKWLGENCSLAAMSANESTEPADGLLTLEFVDGSRLVLQVGRVAQGAPTFRFGAQLFSSKELNSKLASLRELGQF